MRQVPTVMILVHMSCFAQSAVTPGAGPPAKRWALVVGNRAYTEFPELKAASAEVDLMERTLRDAGFEVVVERDFRMPDFIANVEQPFLNKVKPGDICLFYYSGYAVQIAEESANYLLPVNFDPKQKTDIKDRAYFLTRLQQGLERRNASLKIFLLDAPKKTSVSIPGVAPGLANLDLSESRETLSAMATQPGQDVENAPDGAVGLFTRAVVASIEQPGSQLRESLERAKQEAGRETAQKQIPSITDNLITTGFYFHAPLPVKIEPVKLPEPIPAKTGETPAGFPLTNRTDREEYVWIPAGEFKMGCVPNDKKCEPAEKPQHPVRISKGFWLGRTEVTVAAYQRFAEQQKRKLPTAPLENKKWAITNLPMVAVSWDDARTYCQWAGGRLPSEAEWEYAARAGVDNETVPMDSENSREKANFEGKKGNDRFEQAAPVRSFDANKFGLFDMAGNVWEWVGDFYAADFYAQSPAADPAGPAAGKDHVLRGGSFDSDARQHLRLSFRKASSKASNNVGMRCLLEDTPETKKLFVR